jgi:hypothetical protein
MVSRESIYKGVQAFKLENTKYVIRYAKGNEELLKRLLNAGKSGIEAEAFKWSEEHNNEFGNRFETELYDVYWDNVWYNIIKKEPQQG